MTAPAPAPALSAAILAVRVVVGVAFVLHGWPKVHNPFGWMAGMENAPPGSLQAAGAFAEVGGGVLLAAGLLTRVAAVFLAATMVAGVALVHFPKGDPFVAPGKPSWELAAVYFVVCLLILATGPGRFSLDAILFGRGRTPPTREGR
jgi:putative oxidoreductase